MQPGLHGPVSFRGKHWRGLPRGHRKQGALRQGARSDRGTQNAPAGPPAKRGRGRPGPSMTTLFAMTPIFPTLSLRAQAEFTREVVEKVIWDAGAQKLPIRLKRSGISSVVFRCSIVPYLWHARQLRFRRPPAGARLSRKSGDRLRRPRRFHSRGWAVIQALTRPTELSKSSRSS